ncbi:hypothetical protein QL285_059235 [Trifolium repens]|nr:hypothetical protein QL285_059235 [Trifolium repens]
MVMASTVHAVTAQAFGVPGTATSRATSPIGSGNGMNYVLIPRLSGYGRNYGERKFKGQDMREFEFSLSFLLLWNRDLNSGSFTSSF